MAAKSVSSDSPRAKADSGNASQLVKAGSQAESADWFPKKGERALSIGKTGSGKTTFNRWLLQRLPDAPLIIYDTKHDPKFDQLPHNRVAYTMAQTEEALEHLGTDYVIVRPPPVVTANPNSLDAILLHHEANWRGVDAYIDELYHFHSGGRAGPGLNGLYTRGRSRGITTIGSTQRPAWVSGFVFSETQLFYIFRLTRDSDRKKVKDFIPGFDLLANPTGHSFYLHRDENDDAPKLMPAIPLAKGEDLGYTDHEKEPETADSDQVEPSAKIGSNVWL